MALRYGHTIAEKLTLGHIAAMRRCGLSWSVIARQLNDAGSRTRGGKVWTRVSVAERFNKAVRGC